MPQRRTDNIEQATARANAAFPLLDWQFEPGNLAETSEVSTVNEAAVWQIWTDALAGAEKQGLLLSQNIFGADFNQTERRYEISAGLSPGGKFAPTGYVCPFGALCLAMPAPAPPVWNDAVVRFLGVTPEWFAGVLHGLDDTGFFAWRVLPGQADYEAGRDFAFRLRKTYAFPEIGGGNG